MLVINSERFYGHKPLVAMNEAELEDFVVKALHGGRAEREGKKPSDFPKRKLKEGAKHEREHTDDEKTAEQIAADHLAEDPAYYKKLKKIEKALPGTGDKAKQAAKLDAKRSAKRNPPKAGKVTASGGSKQYGYPEANPARSHKAKGEQGGQAQQEGPPHKSGGVVDAPSGGMAKQVDPTHLASLLHLEVSDLKALADRLPINKFIAWFQVHYAMFMRAHKVPRNYLEELHEVLTSIPANDPRLAKSIRGHKAYTRRSRSGKMVQVASRPGERKMRTQEIQQLRQRHITEAMRKKAQFHLPQIDLSQVQEPPSAAARKFKVGDTIKHPEMGLGVVTSVGVGQPNLLGVSFTSQNDEFARENPKKVKDHFAKFKKPLDTSTTVGAHFVSKVTVKTGGKTDALRSRIMGVRR